MQLLKEILDSLKETLRSILDGFREIWKAIKRFLSTVYEFYKTVQSITLYTILFYLPGAIAILLYWLTGNVIDLAVGVMWIITVSILLIQHRWTNAKPGKVSSVFAAILFLLVIARIVLGFSHLVAWVGRGYDKAVGANLESAVMHAVDKVKTQTNNTNEVAPPPTRAQITELQRKLSTDPTIYPEGYVTGYYGTVTRAAVKKFQSKYGLPVTGEYDMETRKKVAEVYP